MGKPQKKTTNAATAKPSWWDKLSKDNKAGVIFAAAVAVVIAVVLIIVMSISIGSAPVVTADGSQGVSTSAPAAAPPASASSACLDWNAAVVAGASNPDNSGLRPALSETAYTDIQDAVNDSTDSSTLTTDLTNLFHAFNVGGNTDAGIAAVNADCQP
jgi:hypothetical protein